MITVYAARAMTGRVKEEVVKEAIADKDYLEKAGFKVLCPVLGEKVKPTKTVLKSSKKQMDTYWPRDLEMIRNAHLVFNFSPHLPSIGVIREHGYAQYGLKKPVVSIFPKDCLPRDGAICFYEDAYVTDSLLDAAHQSQMRWGTWSKRMKWRIARLFKKDIKAVYFRLLEWWK